MTTAGTFADINNDGWPDLIVTGEWMPLKIFTNEKGHFKESDITASTGLWQSLYVTDVNGDGFADILAGNWGHNTKFFSGKNGPLKLYLKDFDNNGSLEQVVAYTINGEEYTFLCKDELERSLPVLKKAYLTYSEVAGKTVQYMFYDLFAGSKELKAETLSSSCFINNGKGGFTRTDLPDELQLSPVFSFTDFNVNGKRMFLGGGNFYGVIPYEGRYDAMQTTAFSFDKASGKFSVTGNIPDARGEVRDIKWVKGKAGELILVMARNNDSVLYYKTK